MSDYITIAEASSALKGNIIVHVASLGALKSGNTKAGEPYNMQEAVVKDNSGAITLQLWNDDIGKLEAGKIYKLDSPYWKDYKGKAQLSLGNYCQVNEADASELLPASGTLDGHVSPIISTSMSPHQGDTHDVDKLDFAETSLTRFIKTIKEQELDPMKAMDAFGQVWNTAIMQKR